MTEDQKKIKRYVNKLERRLKLPLEIKARINGDIGTEIHLRLESGKSVDEVLEEMGSPQAVAERLNREFAEYAVPRSPARFVFLVLAVLTMLGTVLGMVEYRQAQKELIHVIGGADGPTAIFLAGRIPDGVTYWTSALGVAFGCLAGYFLAAWGKGEKPGRYRMCVLLSAAGLLLNLGSFAAAFMQGTGVLQWTLSAGISEITLAPGLILNLVILILAVRRMRGAKQSKPPM